MKIMKIRLAILDNDSSYLERITSVFGMKYSGKLEVYSFTDMESAMGALRNSKIEVLLADGSFPINFTEIPPQCAFAYLVDSQNIESMNGKKAICKFQKPELIYNQVLALVSDNAENISFASSSGDGAKILLFASPCGGVGTSTMAAACAVHFAQKRKKVLYLNLERLPSTTAFFDAEGQYDMADIIYSIKSKKSNLSLKLEGCVRQDASGVYFYFPSKSVLDILELTIDEIIELLETLSKFCSYDYIITDMDFELDSDIFRVSAMAYATVCVSDGSEVANIKYGQWCSALEILEQDENRLYSEKIYIAYNKFSNKSGKLFSDSRLKNIGGAQRFEHATVQQIIAQLSGMEIFEEIV